MEAYSSPIPGDAHEVRTDILVRAVAFPEMARPGYAVIIDLPVHDSITQQLRRDTGVEMRGVSVVSATADTGTVASVVKPIAGRGEPGATAVEPANGGIFGNLRSFLESRLNLRMGTLLLSTQLSIGELYERFRRAGPASSKSSQAPLLILFVIGGCSCSSR